MLVIDPDVHCPGAKTLLSVLPREMAAPVTLPVRSTGPAVGKLAVVVAVNAAPLTVALSAFAESVQETVARPAGALDAPTIGMAWSGDAVSICLPPASVSTQVTLSLDGPEFSNSTATP